MVYEIHDKFQKKSFKKKGWNVRKISMLEEKRKNKWGSLLYLRFSDDIVSTNIIAEPVNEWLRRGILKDPLYRIVVDSLRTRAANLSQSFQKFWRIHADCQKDKTKL